jgi:hypothetical protein
VGRDRDLLAEVGVVSAVTVAVLAADIVTGGSLQTASLMGYSPVIAGRLYGLGNVAFALFATALIFLAAWCGGLASRRDGPGRAPQVVLGIGVIGLVVVGLPAFGSDFGGMLAMTTGFGVFYLGTRGRRMTARRLLAIGGASVGVVALVSVVDWLRPAESRSHLGTFVQQVLDGELGDVLARKLANNLDILVNSALAASVLLVLIVLAALLLRPFDRSTSVLHRAFAEAPLLGPALTGWLTVMVVGFAVNDSGVAIPAVGMMLTVPFLIVISVKLLSRQERSLRAPSVGASVD